MIETAAKGLRFFEVPEVTCDTCGKVTYTQVYELKILRSKVKRTWQFCSLKCLKGWADPMR